MTDCLGPRSPGEEIVFAEEGLLVDVQVAIGEAMRDAGVSDAELAQRLDLTEQQVEAWWHDDADLSIRLLARIGHALGTPIVVTATAATHRPPTPALVDLFRRHP